MLAGWCFMAKERSSDVRYAFLQSIPVMLGYLFLGMAFGLMLQDAGYHFIWALFCSVIIYAGSMQFLLVTLLTGGAGLIYSGMMTLFINGRHIFYGLSFLEKFKKMGKAYPYMVFSLTDETYSILCDLKVPEGRNEKRVAFFIALFDHCYWIIGSVSGALIGQLFTFDSTGVDFSMTALFVVIVMNQWSESNEHRPTILGFVVGIGALCLLGAERFLLPSLILLVAVLLILRPMMKIESNEDEVKTPETEV
jgi:4-azaleucine resistance transporter AzlC